MEAIEGLWEVHFLFFLLDRDRRFKDIGDLLIGLLQASYCNASQLHLYGFISSLVYLAAVSRVGIYRCKRRYLNDEVT